jgi:DNA polymerase/3'-5' exonuclease PolX
VRHDRTYAYLCAIKIAETIDPFIQKFAIAGSYRRLKPSVGDIDIQVIPKNRFRESRINAELAKICVGMKLENSGSGMSSGTINLDSEPMPFQVFFTGEDEWGACLMYATGSREYNIAYRSFAKKHYGLTVNQYGVLRKGKLIPNSGYSERAVCRAIHIPWLPPQDRTDRRLFPR